MRPIIALLLTTALAAAATWHPLGTWTGDGTKSTETFTTTQREWRVRWTVRPANSDIPTSLVSVTVRDAEDSLVTLASGSADGESIVRGRAGKYYLQISGVNAEWTVTAEEQRE